MQDNNTNNLDNTQGGDSPMPNPPVEPVMGETDTSMPDTNTVSDISMSAPQDFTSQAPSSDAVMTPSVATEPVVTPAPEPVQTESTDQFNSAAPVTETPADQSAPKKTNMTQVILLVVIGVVLVALLGYYFLVMN